MDYLLRVNASNILRIITILRLAKAKCSIILNYHSLQTGQVNKVIQIRVKDKEVIAARCQVLEILFFKSPPFDMRCVI